MTEPRYTSFGAICEHSAFGPRFSSEEYASDGNVACLRTMDIDANGRIAFDAMPLAKLDLSRLRNHLLRNGDLVITRTGAYLGKAAVFTEFRLPVLAGAFSIYFRVKREIADPVFVRYFFNSSTGQEAIQSVATGSAQPNLNIPGLHSLRIPLPPLAEQRAIARVLGALDDKIELNRRLNRSLEELAQAVFRSWFVDFDPVTAKSSGRPPVGLDPATAELFPNQFQDSELGLIPKGWGVASVGEVIEGLYDGPHATPPDSNDGPVFLGIKNLTGTSIDLTEIRHISESDWPRWTRRVEPTEGDIVFTYEATIGFFALIPPGLRCCLGRRLALVRPSRTLPHVRDFLFHTFISDPFQILIESRVVRGSTVDRTSLLEFPNFRFVWPGDAIRAAFARTVAPLWNQIHTIQVESHSLAAARDALLPPLLSGELRVPDAERFVEGLI